MIVLTKEKGGPYPYKPLFLNKRDNKVLKGPYDRLLIGFLKAYLKDTTRPDFKKCQKQPKKILMSCPFLFVL